MAFLRSAMPRLVPLRTVPVPVAARTFATLQQTPASATAPSSTLFAGRAAESVPAMLTGKISTPFHPAFIQSYDSLTCDVLKYDSSKFNSRFRHLSAFRWVVDQFVEVPTCVDLFNGTRAFHTFHARSQPKPLAPALVDAGIFNRLLCDVTQALPIDRSKFIIGVNQVRVIADKDHAGSPAPSLHQDGYDFSLHLNVQRTNVQGGQSVIAASADPATIKLRHYLQPGEFVFFNDRRVFHTATPVECDNPAKPTSRDMVIFDFVHVDTLALHQLL